MSKKHKKNGGGESKKEDIKNSSAEKEENKNNDDNKEMETEEKIEVSSVEKENFEPEIETKEQVTISELDEKAETQKTIKNLISAVILLAGVAVGSFFVDIVQFASGDGFSKRALNNSEVLVAGDRTWVAFDQPAVDVKVLTVGEDEMADCANCDPKEVLLWLRDYIPTMVVNNIDANSEEGKAMIEAYNVKALPAFFFSNDIEKTKFFQGEGSVVFKQVDGLYELNSAGLGIPVGKYLETPAIEETDPVMGNRDAKLKIVVFSDFQCPYCGEYFKSITGAVKEFDQNDVVLSYKDFPLSFHLQAKNAAMAARCAQDQGKFWEMGTLLYDSQADWQDTEGVASFKKYARDLNLDALKFNKCIDEGSFNALIEKDMDEANEIGVSGAPATFIGTQFSSGVVPAADLKMMIQSELDKNTEGVTDEDINASLEEIQTQTDGTL